MAAVRSAARAETSAAIAWLAGLLAGPKDMAVTQEAAGACYQRFFDSDIFSARMRIGKRSRTCFDRNGAVPDRIADSPTRR